MRRYLSGAYPQGRRNILNTFFCNDNPKLRVPGEIT